MARTDSEGLDFGALLDAPHRRGGRFFCPWGARRRTVADILRWQIRRVPAKRRRPQGEIPTVENDGVSLSAVAERPELTWIGHCSFALHEGETKVLFDPHFGRRALLPTRWTEPGIPVGSVPDDAIAVLSHNHYDHLDRWTLGVLPKGVRWLVPLGLGSYVRSFGFDEVRELDWWDEAELDGWRFTLFPTQHWSRRLTQPENTTLWGGWLVDTGTARIFFAGDSGWFEGFAELGRRLAPIDAALLPIGAYEPRWFMRVAHMDPEEALAATRVLGARRMIPMHWGAFDLADDAVDEPPRALERLLAKPGNGDLARRVARMAVGERRAIG